MTAHGNGSEMSPIVISDDEGEIVSGPRQQVKHSIDSQSEREHLEAYAARQARDTRLAMGMKMMLGMGYTPGRGLGFDLDGQVEPVPVVLKRKRDEGGVGCIGSNDSPARTLAGVFDDAFLATPESKKARKKRRKMEREALKHDQGLDREKVHVLSHMRARQQEPRMPPLQPMSTPHPTISTLGPRQSIPTFLPQHLSQEHGRFPPSMPTPGLIPTVRYDGPTASTSLPQPALFSQRIHNTTFPINGLPPKPVTDLLFPASLPPSASLLSRPMSAFPPSVPLNPQKSAASRKLKQPVKAHLPIGVQLEPGTTGPIRGGFRMAQRPDGSTYTANPIRTLIMTQVPKHLRQRDFVNSWCKKVCGSHAAYVELDTLGNALVEFPSADMAQKAFVSPRLRGGKGKASIRAWWYKTEGRPSPMVKEGEMEEGEIDEEANSQPSVMTASTLRRNDAKADAHKPPLESSRVIPQAGLVHHTAQFNFRPPITTRQPFPLRPIVTASNAPAHGLGQRMQPYSASTNESTVKSGIFHSTSAADRAEFLLAADEDEEDNSIASSRSSPERPDGSPFDHFSADMGLDSPVQPHFPDEFQDLTIRHHPNGRSNMAETGVSFPQQLPETIVRSSAHFSTTFEPPLHPATSDVEHSSTLSSASRVIGSASPMSTTTPPSEPPSEPRAMRDLPKAPSFTKRSLLARQKELEDVIAQRKSELIKTRMSAPPETTPSESTATAPALTCADKDLQRSSVEENLRQLVLDSKRGRVANATPVVDTDLEESRKSLSPPPTVSDALPVPLNQDSLEILAVSFITEAIQTVKTDPSRPSVASVKSELAAKQQRLEEHIAESKILMARLTAAQTKQEKDEILRVMRERSRMMDADLKLSPSTTGTVNYSWNRSAPSMNGRRYRWPDTPHESVILIVSDDEEDDEE